MKNGIKYIFVKNVQVDPVQADIEITVYPESLTSDTEIRGRLVGPTCVSTSTVEVAYPLREVSRESEPTPIVILRAAVPEPCLWDQETPFLYRVMLELLQGQVCDQKNLMHAITR